MTRHKWSAVSCLYIALVDSEDSLSNRNASFVAKLKELQFVVVIATKSFTLHVLGNKGTSLVLRFSPSVLFFVHCRHSD